MRVRVVAAREGQQPAGRHRRLGHRAGPAPLGQLAQHLAELALQIVAGIEDRIGPEQQPHIAGAGLVEMRVGARPHHGLDRDAIAGHVPGHIGQHADGRHRLRFGAGSRGQGSGQRSRAGHHLQGSDHGHSGVVRQGVP